ncbi:helix-turn-helix domain-containing protein [Streptomyces zagrosensis]|uniref:Transcriptional regulator with XRE-family HTH domain n=1 Tax=Streptomyces zagrosensis TaxID=1042984 RepID=A0A7W9UZL3_9ACTN|nr:helix-turn-helix transcriptional regulator [Streptomyces zagrosensis]MBB5936857.1 transcriptional regulator with XRE-family HTH domain [Streptomyces zagrosensis]
MGLRTNPTQRQRRLGIELRKLREARGLTLAQAASFAGLGAPHLGHIEAARTAIPEVKLRALADGCGCKNEALVNALVAMSNATGKGWWSRYKETLAAGALDLAELESSAVGCKTFQWIYVPGLLQTPDYTRALLKGGSPDASLQVVEASVAFRLHRQRIITDEPVVPLHAVIHEAALHMQFVGAEVMRKQIEHLVGMARLPHVRIQILPFTARDYPARFGTPFVVFESVMSELNTVYVEHPVSSPFVNEPSQLAEFSDAFDRLSGVSLPPIDLLLEPEFHMRKDSLGLIQHLLYAL